MEYPGAWYHVMNRGRRKKALGKERGKTFQKATADLTPFLFINLRMKKQDSYGS